MMCNVSERISIAGMALLSLVALFIMPWAALGRETGARGAVMVLPETFIDFTARTAEVAVSGQLLLTVALVVLLGLVLVSTTLQNKLRHASWLVLGVALIACTAIGINTFMGAIENARIGAFITEVERTLESPRPAHDIAALEDAIAHAPERSLEDNLQAARDGGLVIRRMPYSGAQFGASAFLMFVMGAVLIFLGLQRFRAVAPYIHRILRGIAVPAVSILLALATAAVVILLLQPTPMSSSVMLDGWYIRLVGRIDTLWYAYLTLFYDALGTGAGFAEALKFATPLIFTGLAVGFGFQAGLFNIGAPGQMLMGAIFAMFAGVYLPGPKFIVLPLSVLAAAIGGGLWGALPGWLKARFGANEVINTILLNFVAASVLLFILSAGNVFAAGALRMLAVIGIFIVVALLLALIPAFRSFAVKSPRLIAAIGLVALLAVAIPAAVPREGDQPYTLNLPFKVKGNEPKSQELQHTARLPQLPAMLGIDLKTSPGTNRITLNFAWLAAPLAGLVAFVLAPKFARTRRWGPRILLTLGVAGAVWGIFALFDWTSVRTAIPPTKLNFSFVIAIASAWLVHYILFRTKLGYELRAVGLSPKAAEYGGANIGRNTIITMAISGALAGLTATHYVLGGALEDYALRQSIPSSDGFDGIAVALLGANQPAGIVAGAFLFGVLKYGGSLLNITFPELTREVVSMILALVVLFIAARGFLPARFSSVSPLTKDEVEA